MESTQVLGAIVFIIVGIGIKPIIGWIYSLTKKSEDIDKDIAISKKETSFETQQELTVIKMKQEQQQKDIEELKKKHNNSEEEIKQIKILETKFDSMQKQIDGMGHSQERIISKLDKILEMKLA